ncbi:proteasome assembly chaperone family protein [archaeon]|nr:proteasome assembly chaperone family protein [archaeon]
MKIILDKVPKKVKIIEGFPGFGLIGTIVTEFLIEHLKPEMIGTFEYDEMPATVAIHDGKLINPMGVFYDKKNNLIIMHTILNSVGLEWDISKSVRSMAQNTECNEIICIEGVASPNSTENKKVFYFADDRTKEKVSKLPVEQLKESIIVGVTSALMLQKDVPVTCFFAETKTKIPDSKAAANIIKVLNEYLGLNVDVNPLLEQAEKFEKKFKNILKQSSMMNKKKEKRDLSYFG